MILKSKVEYLQKMVDICVKNKFYEILKKFVQGKSYEKRSTLVLLPHKEDLIISILKELLGYIFLYKLSFFYK